VPIAVPLRERHPVSSNTRNKRNITVKLLSGTWNVLSKVMCSPAISVWSWVAKEMRCTEHFWDEYPLSRSTHTFHPRTFGTVELKKKRDCTHNDEERGRDITSYGERSSSEEKGETFSNGFWNIDQKRHVESGERMWDGSHLQSKGVDKTASAHSDSNVNNQLPLLRVPIVKKYPHLPHASTLARTFGTVEIKKKRDRTHKQKREGTT